MNNSSGQVEGSNCLVPRSFWGVAVSGLMFLPGSVCPGEEGHFGPGGGLRSGGLCPGVSVSGPMFLPGGFT